VTPRTLPPDQVQRDLAIAERQRNVLIDAGAGTGKTTILVDRLIETVAPRRMAAPAVPIGRLAAITFTRKAAGELRLRIRERLLRELAAPRVGVERAGRLRDALAGLDTAHVGTIHSFADRLLRLRPVEAELSPSYEVAEDDDKLIRETVDVLLHAAQNGTLEAELAGTGLGARAAEATTILLFALTVGLPAESRETEWVVFHGLDGLVAGFVHQRDIPPSNAEPAPFDTAAFRAAADEFVRIAQPVTGRSAGASWVRRTAGLLRRLRDLADPLLILRDLWPQLDRKPRDAKKGATFHNDGVAWDIWKTFWDGSKRRPTPLQEDLCGPLDRWMATRLVRLFPVVVALYEKVKARNRALDQLDLLVKLRDLLVRDRAVRSEFQQMFDHVFVDEFQDTDPLQAEIILFLCEREPVAARWEDVQLRPAALTLVGDPKQSIYRFRRADVSMYDRVRGLVARQDALTVTLSANFRSVGPLIDWLNDRFDRVLGRSPDGRPFDPATGVVFQQPLDMGREHAAGPAVHVLPFGFRDAVKHNVDEYRRLEGQVLARYLRWLVTASDVRIQDPLDGQLRPVRYGDIAILAVSTWNLPLLFSWLDTEGIPYASRGGTLFLQDPLHRQFLLGLRAIADRDDGVAEAALLRPSFFAVDPADLLRDRAAPGDGPGADDEAVRRAREARALVRELRQKRFACAPGATARDLLDRTAFARATALGPNGTQRLARLRELCLLLEQTAAAGGLDYDAATARMRDWVNEPVQLDPPHPVGTDAVQALTVHQAKGLEFPVVVFWDGRLTWDTRIDRGAWRMERDGRGWVMHLEGLDWEEPAGLRLKDTEKAYLDAERRRVVYVAATRARALLVIPRAGAPDPSKMVCGALLAGADPALVRELDIYLLAAEPAWAQAVQSSPQPDRADGARIEREVGERWTAAAAEAARPRFRPASVSGEAQVQPPAEEPDAPEPLPRKSREGRFGSVFGETVHRAIGILLRDRSISAEEAIQRAARRTGLGEHLEEAVGDVSRTLRGLGSEGLLGPIDPYLQIEYPVAGLWDGGQLLGGYIDLVSAGDGRLDVIDFKTDAPPVGPVEHAYPAYASQVRLYGDLLLTSGVAGRRHIRCGLLFTADGRIRRLNA
jgi:ATP-dependent helicase/nuclease subunit A